MYWRFDFSLNPCRKQKRRLVPRKLGAYVPATTRYAGSVDHQAKSSFDDHETASRLAAHA